MWLPITSAVPGNRSRQQQFSEIDHISLKDKKGFDIVSSVIHLNASEMALCESYWDKLPLEIQEIIVRLSENQIAYEKIIERDCHICGKVLWKGPKSVKNAWKLGRVYLTNCKCIYGGYYDQEHNYQTMLLGWDEKNALRRMNHVKSFL